MHVFSGIVEEKGTLVSIERGAQSGRLKIAARKVLEDVHRGDSIAVNGVCLTVTSFEREQFTADVMPVTLKKTTLGHLRAGQQVNLERALQLHSRFGGHLVSGHVDAVGQILTIRPQDHAIYLEIEAPEKVKPILIPEGSIAVDGISLTVAALTPKGFMLSVIPHTAKETTLAAKNVGDWVNLEGDLIGKYLYHFWQRTIEADTTDKRNPSQLTWRLLEENGFFSRKG